MKVYVDPNYFKSDVFEVDDDITKEEANEIACEWICDNISGVLKREDGLPMKWETKE